MGVNKLTGINSEAISSDTQSAMEPTALQVCFGDKSDCVVMVAMEILRRAGSSFPESPEGAFSRFPDPANLLPNPACEFNF
jgi:hypothetical protein